jgi:hypothetical protein
MDFPASGATENLATPEQWRALFSRFSHVILVANSDEVSVKELQDEYPETALFVFFNKVYKVLDEQFSGHSLLISRAQPKGANIVYRNEVADVVKLFAPRKFLGIMNIRLAESERLNTNADYLGTPTGHLDLAGFCADFYSKDKVATSGFAMALWLVRDRSCRVLGEAKRQVAGCERPRLDFRAGFPAPLRACGQADDAWLQAGQQLHDTCLPLPGTARCRNLRDHRRSPVAASQPDRRASGQIDLADECSAVL